MLQQKLMSATGLGEGLHAEKKGTMIALEQSCRLSRASECSSTATLAGLAERVRLTILCLHVSGTCMRMRLGQNTLLQYASHVAYIEGKFFLVLL